MMTKAKNKEIEVKFNLKNLADFIERLSGLKAKRGETQFQRTYSMFRPDFSCVKEGFFLRTREEGKKQTFTVKINKGGTKNYYERDEYEVEVSNAKNVAKMLSIIGFSTQRIFEKYRQEWFFPDSKAKVFIDKIPILGDFIEIEGTKKEIEKLIKRLGLDKEERITVAYWNLYHQKMGKFEGDMVFKK